LYRPLSIVYFYRKVNQIITKALQQRLQEIPEVAVTPDGEALLRDIVHHYENGKSYIINSRLFVQIFSSSREVHAKEVAPDQLYGVLNT